ncbi:hypothetical protein OCK74_01170 [Chitinophagaceae bacterium LB-8]|uniref:Uncharacterized protein n=1 Tax=Paraflavisolibacter caeni TaxID=2982496 RepID=A0A9X2XU45_9BACT|nr:hypothetical protein [Paraflavisolibacter caeni]MCU7547698.1 hypothetical protein [Paraflavisolibacter caeni]
MKQISFILFLSVLLASVSFATANRTNCCKTKYQKTVAVKNKVVTKRSVLELAKRAAQVSSSQKDIFPEFIIGNTFYKL